VVSSSFSKSVESKIRQRSKFSTPIQYYCIGVQILHASAHPTSWDIPKKFTSRINFLLRYPLPRRLLRHSLSHIIRCLGMICDLDDDFHRIVATRKHSRDATHTAIRKNITLQSFVLRSNPSQHSLPFRIVIFLGNC